MCQIKTKTTDYLFPSILYLISALCCTLAHQCFIGMGLALRLSLQPWVPRIGVPAILVFIILGTDFSIFLHTFQNCLAILRLSDPTRHQQAKSCETVSWHPKPRVSRSNCEGWKVCCGLYDKINLFLPVYYLSVLNTCPFWAVSGY